MAGVRINVHDQYAPDYGPASRFIPSTLQVQEQADPGGGKPSEPSALVFTDPRDGESHVYLLTDAMRLQLVRMLTGGIVLPGLEAA